jgi:uncharacterized protein (TIRG00374 family)
VTRLKVVAAIAISLAIVVYMLSTVDLAELRVHLGRARWGWVAVGIVAGLAGLFARAARWRYLFPPASNPPAIVPAMMIGYMANNVLPLRAGEFVRVYVVARRWHHGFWLALATLVIERVLDSLSLVLILGVLVLLVPVPAIFRNAALVILAIDVAGVVTLAALAVFPDTGRALLVRLGRRWPAPGRRLARVYDMFVRGLEGIRTPAHLVPILGWTIVIWILPAAAAWTTLRAFELDLPWLAGWAVVAFVGLGISIPSAPGYIGVFHFAAAKAVDLFGIAPAAAVAFAIVFHAGQYIAVTLTGWVYLVREGLSLGEATRAHPPVDAET